MTDQKMLEELEMRWDEVADRYSMNEDEMFWVLKQLKQVFCLKGKINEINKEVIDLTYDKHQLMKRIKQLELDKKKLKLTEKEKDLLEYIKKYTKTNDSIVWLATSEYIFLIDFIEKARE